MLFDPVNYIVNEKDLSKERRINEMFSSAKMTKTNAA